MKAVLCRRRLFWAPDFQYGPASAAVRRRVPFPSRSGRVAGGREAGGGGRTSMPVPVRLGRRRRPWLTGRRRGGGGGGAACGDRPSRGAGVGPSGPAGWAAVALRRSAAGAVCAGRQRSGGCGACRRGRPAQGVGGWGGWQGGLSGCRSGRLVSAGTGGVLAGASRLGGAACTAGETPSQGYCAYVALRTRLSQPDVRQFPQRF